MNQIPWEPLTTPRALGLPKQFKFWREGQYEALEAICQSQKPVFLLDSPTGTGKSVIGIAAYSKIATIQAALAQLKGEEHPEHYRCVYLTRTKQLQEQVVREFPMAKMVKGRSNYPCLLRENDFPEFTAEDCRNKGQADGLDSFSTLKCEQCFYRVAKREAFQAPVAVLNDAYFLSEVSGPAMFSGCNLLVVDEVDSIEGALMNFVQFSISEKQLQRFKLKPPGRLDNSQEWVIWAGKVQFEIARAKESLNSQLALLSPSQWSDVEIDMQKSYKRLDNFELKLVSFSELVDENWVFTYDENEKGNWKVIFKPITVAFYADRYLWRHGKRALGMSGSIFDPEILANDVGIEDWDYLRLDSPFPVENRPIYYRPTVNLTHKRMETELPKLNQAISDILDKYSDQRVLVHTVSYKIRDYLLAHLPQQKRLLTHSTDNRDEMLEEFKHSPEPGVMLSPSFDRGVDLPQEACRCIIICKIPYGDLSDKQIKARMSLLGGQRWYNLRAAQTLVQMSGRGVRSKFDYCDSYILDKQFERLLFATKNILPVWWLEAIK